jgi:hypothetical protein
MTVSHRLLHAALMVGAFLPTSGLDNCTPLCPKAKEPFVLGLFDDLGYVPMTLLSEHWSSSHGSVLVTI